MTDDGFPIDEYTPHGYLANPFAVAHSWSEGEGGCLRSSRDYVGFGWQLPWALRAQASVDLVVSLEGDGQQLVTRADFDAAGLHSPHHSANLFAYRWQAFGQTWEATFALRDADQLGVEVAWSPVSNHVPVSEPEPVRLTVALIGWRRDGGVQAVNSSRGWRIDLGEPFGLFEIWADNAWVEGKESPTRIPDATPAPRLASEPSKAAVAWSLDLRPSGGARVTALAWRAHSSHDLPFRGSTPSFVGGAIARARTDDDAFWRGATRLEGDWPASWRRGWVYDTETTRMCIYPPGGIFTDVWPAWMVQWPRAVVAEGTLDMARFAYASPELAQRALLSLFRDATAPNVPCVFQHGEPNMVAADGSVCGTSPAWCVPFYNLERLFSLTLDRDWLAEIYPYLSLYLAWWLAERTDPDGWAVYKCTWEAGEDDTPRLDPERRGDNVVSAFVRPVELQATMALSASVLARFARVLGRQEDEVRWQSLEAEYLDRTRELWDPVEQRFRDWDARNDRFLEPAGEANYWGIDPCRYSALAFTPLLAGIVDHDVRAGLWEEIQRYDGPPWTLWASWSYVVLEAARFTGDPGVHARTGAPPFAGRVAAGIVGRVYDELDARQIAKPSHPTPGVAREYWPLDLDTWASCEGYGWGANTASLLVRQIFGFVEGPYLDETRPLTFELRPALTFELRPALPVEFLVPGREYALANLPYRGRRLTLRYRVADAAPGAAGLHGGIDLLLSANGPTRCRVVDQTAPLAWESDGADEVHEIPVRNGGSYLFELISDA